MANDTDKNLARRIEDQRPAAAIDWSKPGAPAVPLPGTAGAAQGGNTSAGEPDNWGDFIKSCGYKEVSPGHFEKPTAPIPPLTAPAPLTDLHDKIMRLSCNPPCDWPGVQQAYYKLGHRDARHDAAELVLSVEAAPAPQQSELSDERLAELFEQATTYPPADEDFAGIRAFARAIEREVAKAAPAAPVPEWDASNLRKACEDAARVMRAVEHPLLANRPASNVEAALGNGSVAAPVQTAEEVLALHRQLAAEKLRADQGWARAEAKSTECIELRERMAAPVQAEQAQAEPSSRVLAIPVAIMDLSADQRQHQEYLRGFRDAKHEAADLVLARADELAALVAPAVPAQAEQVAAVRAAYERAAQACEDYAMQQQQELSSRASGKKAGGFDCAATIRALATKEAAAPVQAVKEQIRNQALENGLQNAWLECAARACEAERVEETGTDGDKGYNLAIKHCAAAIRSLRTPSTSEASKGESA
jgi:hypothetical protein